MLFITSPEEGNCFHVLMSDNPCSTKTVILIGALALSLLNSQLEMKGERKFKFAPKNFKCEPNISRVLPLHKWFERGSTFEMFGSHLKFLCANLNFPHLSSAFIAQHTFFELFLRNIPIRRPLKQSFNNELTPNLHS